MGWWSQKKDKNIPNKEYVSRIWKIPRNNYPNPKISRVCKKKFQMKLKIKINYKDF